MFQPEFKTGDGWSVPVEEEMKLDLDDRVDKHFEMIQKRQAQIFKFGSVMFVIAIVMALLMCTALALGVVWIWQHVQV